MKPRRHGSGARELLPPSLPTPSQRPFPRTLSGHVSFRVPCHSKELVRKDLEFQHAGTLLVCSAQHRPLRRQKRPCRLYTGHRADSFPFFSTISNSLPRIGLPSTRTKFQRDVCLKPPMSEIRQGRSSVPVAKLVRVIDSPRQQCAATLRTRHADCWRSRGDKVVVAVHIRSLR